MEQARAAPRARRHQVGRGRILRERERRRTVGDEVDEQHLDHRERGSHSRDDRDREHEHLAEVGGEEEGDELPDVVANQPPLVDRGDDRGEVVVREDDRGGLARGLGARLSHRNADVRAAEGGRVVDAVAGDRDDLAARLELFDERELRRRSSAGVDVRLGEPECVPDRACGCRMVAGEHPNGNAGVARLVDRRGCGRPQRIVERNEPDQLELRLDRVAQLPWIVDGPSGYGEHPEALRGPGPGEIDERRIGSNGPLEDDLRSALRERSAIVRAVVDERHELAIRVERNLVHDLAPSGELWEGEPALHRRQEQRCLDRVAQHLSVVGGPRSRCEHRRRQHLALVGASSRAQGGHADLVLGQRAGLVGADDGHLAKGLDRVEPSHDRPAAGKGTGPECQRRGDRRRQPFGDGRHGYRYAHEERGVQGLALQQHRPAESNGQDDPDHDHLARQAGEPPIEGSGRGLRGRRQGLDGAELGRRSSGTHERLAVPARDARAGVEHRAALGERRGRLDRLELLGDRERFAGQGRLVELEPSGLEHARVCRDTLALRDEQEVARNDLLRADLGDQTAADDDRRLRESL